MSLKHPFHGWLAVIFLTMITGCAGERAFREGKRLIDEGKIKEGLARLEYATQLEPSDTKYRSYFYRQRENQTNHLLIRADALRLQGQFDDALALYERVLSFDAANDRAASGIEATRSAKNHKRLLDEAEVLINKGHTDEAQIRVRAVLIENAKHAQARALSRQIEEKKAKERAMSPALKSGLKAPVTLEFRDVSLRAVFDILSQAAQINFVLDKDVRPDSKTTIFVKDTPIEDAIQFLLLTNQLEMKLLSENALLIYPNTPAKLKEYQELVVRSFYLTNADVKQTVNLVKAVAKTKDIFVDEKLNMFVMRDTPEVMRVVEKLVAMQDLAEPEVTLAVEILEISSGRLHELGVRYPGQVGFSVLGAARVAGQMTLNEFKERSADMVRMTVTDPLLIANLRAQDSDSNLLANPRIRVKNREKAKIHIGDRVPVITTTSTSTGFASESVNYLDVGLKLDVEPNVYLDGEVSIKMGLEVSNIVSEVSSKSGTLTYRVGTRNASTTLRLKDGETQILAGLISDEERNSSDKIPGLGDLPLLGKLFSNRKGTKNKTEIVLLVTPYIIRNVEQPDLYASEFTSGTDAAVGDTSLRLRRVEKKSALPPSSTVVSTQTSLPAEADKSDSATIPIVPANPAMAPVRN